MTATTHSTDYAAFLHQHVLSQPHAVMRYALPDETLWVKRAGSSHAAWRYRLLSGVASSLRVPLLQPVPNLGGRTAIATEVQRLRDFAQRGLRVPTVLASCPDGFVMRHLGQPGEDTPSLGNEMETAGQQGATAVLQLWQQGLQAITVVHRAGTCLSQAFARNLVRCPDGVIGYIDFEDDPVAHLPLALCHARDALCYAHSTAWILAQAGALDTARSQWQEWLQNFSPEARSVLLDAIRRMQLVGKLPRSKSLGRDAQRLRMAFELLHGASASHSM